MGPAAKKVFPILVVLAVAIGIFVGLRQRQKQPWPVGEASRETTTNSAGVSNARSRAGTQAPSPANSSNAAAPQPAAASPQPKQVPETPFLLVAADAPPPMEPATVLDKMRIAINNFGSMFKGNPVGTNPEITAALNGDNPKQIKFISEDSGLRINGRGELVDYWGTPFFFHQVSGTEMEIRSAGPDKKMWTADDLVTK